jgi:phosphoribosylformylglycinamidine cyclo-ligase
MSEADGPALTYAQAGVVAAERPLAGLLHWVSRTAVFRQGLGAPALSLGHYANVLDLGSNLGLAISTDGVGSKLLIAELMGKYDTVGIDCVAMNANDVVCVGAEPIAMVDYVGVQAANADVLEQIGRGLYEGARQARISIPGGELAQLPEMIQGVSPGSGLDLVGSCVGLVQMDRLVTGDRVRPGDVLIGIASSGIHSNGLTLARKALFQRAGMGVETRPPELGRSLGEELLEPTRIYVPWVVDLLRSGVPVHGLAHITGDGLLNLPRIGRGVGWRISWLPEPPPIFRLIQQAGDVSTAEMYRVFNMGVGFCLVVPPNAADEALRWLTNAGAECWRIGEATADEDRTVLIEPLGLRSSRRQFATV